MKKPKIVIHRAESRGGADHGWLRTHHTFSFANYYDPDRMGFGALRVINDDEIDGGSGFPTHPHQDMEIVTIPLSGSLTNQDSMGSSSVIAAGDAQVMSAGTGVLHSEYNGSETEVGKFLQIWIEPKEYHVEPRYMEAKIEDVLVVNEFRTIVSPKGSDGLWIYQDAWLSLGSFDRNETVVYTMKKQGNGLYVFVIAGGVAVADESLRLRDGMGIWDTDEVLIGVEAGSMILLLEVPMEH